MKRILITGATSWIGSEVEAHLAAFPGRYGVERVSLRGDAWKERSWEGFDSVLHAAGIASSSVSGAKAELEYRRANVELAADAAAKAKADGVSHFMLMSSIYVYVDGSTEREAIAADTVPRPGTVYGRSKLEAERAVAPLAGTGFEVAVVRSPLVYGPGCSGNFALLAKLARMSPVFPDVDNARSMIFSRNLAELVRLLVEERGDGTFLPQDAEHVRTSELVRLLAEVQGTRIRLSSLLGDVARPFLADKGILGRLFGNLRYDLSTTGSVYDYRLTSLEESVRKSFVKQSQAGHKSNRRRESQ